MPTFDPNLALDLDQAHEHAARRAFCAAPSAPPGRIGLEPELLPIRVDPCCRPAGRVRLEGRGGVLDLVDAVASSEPRVQPRQGPVAGP